jgi:hypothetical protein
MYERLDPALSSFDKIVPLPVLGRLDDFRVQGTDELDNRRRIARIGRTRGHDCHIGSGRSLVDCAW